ncbi:V-type ATPase 116kDa subunit family protein [Streptomyces sp. NPDC053560]|uniref:V-type ATPase 116kDa subunit family protein n=1 Tax=Streptomyces sp. NPDC053560 TaxID=3365711 RepID=UPI0037D4EA89
MAPRSQVRGVLVRLADAGCVEPDRPEGTGHGVLGPAGRRLRRLRSDTAGPALTATALDLDVLEHAGRFDLLAGEAELEERRAEMVERGPVVALVGWCPAADVPGLSACLAGVGGAVVPLRRPTDVEAPTLLRAGGAVHRSFAPLVRTYGTVPYDDVDPAVPTGIAYVVMFGLMFGDAGHGTLLLLAALLLRLGRPRRVAPLRSLWPFVAGAGLASTLAGVAYGEFFGPTGVLPVLWLSPLEDAMTLLASAVAFGALLLTVAYGVGTVNRWRESGPGRALYAVSGIAGAASYLGLLLCAAGVMLGSVVLVAVGAAAGLTGLLLAGTGLFTATDGGTGGVVQTAVQLFDIVVRIFSNTVSFTRIAAFGLTHAALGAVVWQGTTALGGRGVLATAAAVVLFTVGNALAFALEGLVAGVQALRLTFYELFSRVFDVQGRPFEPWHIPTREYDNPPSGSTSALTVRR